MGKMEELLWVQGSSKTYIKLRRVKTMKKSIKINGQTVKVGQTIRKVCYVSGKKHYAVIKLVALQSYKHSHGQDIRRKSKAELVG